MIGEKPQAAWYKAYNGVGALELARNDTVMDAKSGNARFADR
jgi:hypothetical protein